MILSVVNRHMTYRYVCKLHRRIDHYRLQVLYDLLVQQISDQPLVHRDTRHNPEFTLYFVC
jgi:hypothetical protein